MSHHSKVKSVKLKMLYVHCEATQSHIPHPMRKRDKQQDLKQNTKKWNFLCTCQNYELQLDKSLYPNNRTHRYPRTSAWSRGSPGCPRTMCKKQPRRRLFHNHLCSEQSLRSMAMAPKENTGIGIWISSEGRSSSWLCSEITASCLSLGFLWKLTCRWWQLSDRYLANKL